RPTHQSHAAASKESEARITQARGQRDQQAATLKAMQTRIGMARANMVRVNDLLQKHNSYAPLDGMVTNLPVRVGETVVMGLQNSASSTIMTIADMSIIPAEVKQDQTEIVSVRIDESADVTPEASPNLSFKGKVMHIATHAT